MIDWLDTGVIVLVTIAVVNAIKTATNNKLGYYYMLISFAVGAGLFFLGKYAPEDIKTIAMIGLAASGIYDVYTKRV